MTDYTKLIERLRSGYQGIQLGAVGMGWDFEAKTIIEAAEAIEALQGEVEQIEGFWKEAQLRNRNLLEERDALAAELAGLKAQEPIGYVIKDSYYTNSIIREQGGHYTQPVYAAPKAMAPLTADQKNSAWHDHWSNPSIPSTACSAFYAGMRFAEKHHGIGGTP